jgi:hypothetical protein
MLLSLVGTATVSVIVTFFIVTIVVVIFIIIIKLATAI